MRFDLKYALLMMTNVCVLAWASMDDDPAAWIAFVAFVGLTTEWYAAERGNSPFVWGSISGGIAVLALVICAIPLRAIAYLIFVTPPSDSDIFEDGVAFPFIMFPLVAMAYAPVGYLIGLACALIVRGVRSVFGRDRTRSNR